MASAGDVTDHGRVVAGWHHVRNLDLAFTPKPDDQSHGVPIQWLNGGAFGAGVYV